MMFGGGEVTIIGDSAYPPKRLIEKELEFGLLHRIENAPTIRRQVWATYPVRSARIVWIQKSLELVSQHQKSNTTAQTKRS